MITSSIATALRATEDGEQFVIFNGDCRDLLEAMPRKKVNLLVTSPPYFVGKSYDTSTNVDDFKSIHKTLASMLPSIVTDGGNVCWQVGHHVKDGVSTPLDFLIYEIFQHVAPLTLRNRIVWTFGHGVHARRRFSGRHESILWYSNGPEHYFDLDATRVPQKYRGKKHYKGPNKGEWSSHPQGKNPGDVWDIPNVKANHVEKTNHPCQFPVALVQRLVKALSAKKDLVLDPFCGVGSAGIAAILEGRQFLGAELDANYCATAEERWQAARRMTLRIRPLDKPVYQPNPNNTVAKDPFPREKEERV
jgi:adenine-specific DNA-methyltransferase